MTTAVVIVAGGSGLRAGGELPKQYQTLAGRRCIRHTLNAFVCHPGVALTQVVIGEDHEALLCRRLRGARSPAARPRRRNAPGVGPQRPRRAA